MKIQKTSLTIWQEFRSGNALTALFTSVIVGWTAPALLFYYYVKNTITTNPRTYLFK